jgi:hypothetical protein
VAERIFEVHRRHAAAVCKVFDEAISRHRAALREGKLPPSCLLSLIVCQRVSDVEAAYPERAPSAQPTIAARAEIRIAIDKSHRLVVFDRWGAMKGVLADLLISLAGPHREATIDERITQNYPFTNTEQLLRTLRIETETLRRYILRCRKEINRLATEADDPPPSIDAVIENSRRRERCCSFRDATTYAEELIGTEPRRCRRSLGRAPESQWRRGLVAPGPIAERTGFRDQVH